MPCPLTGISPNDLDFCENLAEMEPQANITIVNIGHVRREVEAVVLKMVQGMGVLGRRPLGRQR